MNLDEFENIVCQRDYESAAKAFFQVLSDLESGVMCIKPEEDKILLKGYTRVACAMSYLLSNPNFTLSEGGLRLLLSLHRCFHAVFAASVFENPDELVTKITRPADSSTNQRQLAGEQQIIKLMSVYSLDSAIELDFKALLAEYPHIVLPAYLSMISTLSTLTPKAQQNREELLRFGSIIEDIPLPDSILALTTNAWMLCSYALADDKHEIKRHLNAMIRKMLEKHRVIAPVLPAARPLKSRPRIVLPLEVFTSLHAMYRVYGPAIRQLRANFELIALCKAKALDPDSAQLFDSVVHIDADQLDLRLIVGRLVKLKPDMIYFPSLGMNDFTMALANLRLAPIQLYTVGHPATTHSDCIDYVVNEEKWAGDPATHSETTILAPNKSFPFEFKADTTGIPPEIRGKPEVIRIAVAARVYKLNSSLLLFLQRVLQRATRRVEVHFFPNEAGLYHYAMKRKILDILPEAIVHPRAEYGTYLTWLNRCDLQLGTYPFGGTNSNIDTFKQGLPLVTREGRECHSRTEAAMMRAVGLPEWLIAHSEEEWEDALVRLIENDEERVQLSRQLLAADIGRIFDDDPQHPGTGFVDTVQWLYENHEKIQKDGRKLWVVEARAELEPDSGAKK